MTPYGSSDKSGSMQHKVALQSYAKSFPLKEADHPVLKHLYDMQTLSFLNSGIQAALMYAGLDAGDLCWSSLDGLRATQQEHLEMTQP